MKPRYYILEGKTPVPVSDVREWAMKFDRLNTIINSTVLVHLGDVIVSTVFLGLDHSHSFNFEDTGPILFETMIFGGEHDGYQERYSTWEEAEEGHKKAIELCFV